MSGAGKSVELPEEGEEKEPEPKGPDTSEAVILAMEGFRQIVGEFKDAMGEFRKPRRIVRGPDGRAQGIE